MQCKNCSEAIPSKFSHAIKSNTCPFCGLEIMEKELQSILISLQSIMKDAVPFMDQVEEWLGSNYSFFKSKNKDITTSNKSNENDDNESIAEAIIKAKAELAKSAIDFQKRAGVKKLDTKSLIEKIRGGVGAADPSEFVGEDPDYGPMDFSDETSIGTFTSLDAEEMSSSLNTGDDDPVAKHYELEKLKKLQRNTGGGFTRR